jgi:hypothetical protein
MSDCRWYGCVVCGELRRALESGEDDPDCHCAPPEPTASVADPASRAPVASADEQRALTFAAS